MGKKTVLYERPLCPKKIGAPKDIPETTLIVNCRQGVHSFEKSRVSKNLCVQRNFLIFPL